MSGKRELDQVDSGVGASGGANEQPHHHQPVDGAAGFPWWTDVEFVRLRITMREKIFEYIGKLPTKSAEWCMPVAVQLEEILYRKFPNKNDYSNMMKGPIKPQLQFAVQTLRAQQNQRNPQVERQTPPSSSSNLVVQTSQGLYTEKVHEDSRYMELNILERIVNESEEPRDLDFALRQSITENFAKKKKIGSGGCGTVYKDIPQMHPQRHDSEAGGSRSAPPQPPQTDPALLAILERMRQDQARQAQETATALTQVQAKQDEFQRQQQQQAMQQHQLLMQQQLLGFMRHVVTAIGVAPPPSTPQLGQPATTLATLALQPSGLQSQGQPATQFASPTEQVSQWFTSPVPTQGPSFTPIITGFTPAQSSSVLVTDTPVFRSLGATFSELTGQPTSPELHVPVPTTIAPFTRTTEMLPSSVTSSEPAATVVPVKSQAAPVPQQTQITSASLLATEGQTAQSSRLEDDATQFQIAHRTSAPDSSAPAPPTDP